MWRETGARDFTHLPLRCCFLYKAPQIRSCTHPPDCAANFEFVHAALRHGLGLACAHAVELPRVEGVARVNGKRADRPCLTFIRSSSRSTTREQQPSMTRSRCHRPSASEGASGHVQYRALCACVKGDTTRAAGIIGYLNLLNSLRKSTVLKLYFCLIPR
ncbi:uncharacterized [Tachysurus ichikawai]